jgi:RsiW-degrading membrane proteinase PrsW (M82 family)
MVCDAAEWAITRRISGKTPHATWRVSINTFSGLKRNTVTKVKQNLALFLIIRVVVGY